MSASRESEACGERLLEVQGELLSSRVIDGSFLVVLAAMPLLVANVDTGALALLVVIAVGGAVTLYQRASRVKRLSRCCWLLFLALGTAIYLATRVSVPSAEADAIESAAGVGVLCAVAASFAAWGLKLIAGRRLPRLADAFDLGAAATIGILMIAAAAFAVSGESRAIISLMMPSAVIGMHFIVRDQCQSLRKARWLVQIATLSTIVAVIGWTVTI
jgi:hypothetical protein